MTRDNGLETLLALGALTYFLFDCNSKTYRERKRDDARLVGNLAGSVIGVGAGAVGGYLLGDHYGAELFANNFMQTTANVAGVGAGLVAGAIGGTYMGGKVASVGYRIKEGITRVFGGRV